MAVPTISTPPPGDKESRFVMLWKFFRAFPSPGDRLKVVVGCARQSVRMYIYVYGKGRSECICT